MTTTASRRLNILCIKFKISPFIIAKLFVQLYVRVDILLTSENNLHNRMIPLEGSWVHKTQLTLPLCIEVHVPSQESEQCVVMCFMIEGIDLTLSTIAYSNSELFRNIGIFLFLFLFL